MDEAHKQIFRMEYWIEIAREDLYTAEVLLKGHRFVHMGFMCHQTVEKLLKAYFCKQKSAIAPFTHNLIVLAKESGVFDILSKHQQRLLDVLQPLNIESRYPSYREKLVKDLSEESCNDLFQQTKEFFSWLQDMLSK